MRTTFIIIALISVNILSSATSALSTLERRAVLLEEPITNGLVKDHVVMRIQESRQKGKRAARRKNRNVTIGLDIKEHSINLVIDNGDTPPLYLFQFFNQDYFDSNKWASDKTKIKNSGRYNHSQNR